MAKASKGDDIQAHPAHAKRAPAKTLEAREKQLISLAVDLAEKQLINGTATSQVMTHYLQLGTTKAQIERDILSRQEELLSAKTDAMKSAKTVEELYSKALDAMRKYSGSDSEEVYDD